MFKIAKTKIGLKYKPFIIAEMSGNHNQSISQALEIVNAAADSGAHALKIQTYTPDTITLDLDKGDFFIKDKDSLWKGRSLYSLYEEAHTPWDWHKAIFNRANELGMICFSSPFDETAVDFLEDLKTPAYKIASFENAHLPLLKKVASTGKPIIISTGMADLGDLDNIVQVLRESGCKDFALLKCTSTYPASPKNSNVLSIPHMRKLFNCEIGLSDHTMGIGTSIGKVVYGPTREEQKSRIFRRSIYISEDVKKGDKLNKKNLKIIRPGYGLSPKYYDIFIGKKVKKNLEKGTPLSWDLIFED